MCRNLLRVSSGTRRGVMGGPLHTMMFDGLNGRSFFIPVASVFAPTFTGPPAVLTVRTVSINAYQRGYFWDLKHFGRIVGTGTW